MQTPTWHRQVDRGRNFVSFQQTSFHLPHLSLLLDGRHAQDARTAGEIKPRAASLLRYGEHLSPMLLDLAREIAGPEAAARAARLADPDYPYLD